MDADILSARCCLPIRGIPCQLPVLDLAVYLYLRTVNQTLADGFPDYREGRLIRKTTIGQRFVGRCLTKID